MQELVRGLKDGGFEVCIIDPLYLCLLASGEDKKAGNIFGMGALLNDVADAIKEAQCTPIFAHHTTKTHSKTFEPTSLGDLLWSGIGEFARQWILLGRRSAYQMDGRHELWLTIGGSTGQSGEYPLNVSEGLITDNFDGRYWDVEILTKREVAELALEAKADNAEKDVEHLYNAIQRWAVLSPERPTKKNIRERLKWGVNRGNRAFDSLLSCNPCRVKSIAKKVNGGETTEYFVVPDTAEI